MTMTLWSYVMLELMKQTELNANERRKIPIKDLQVYWIASWIMVQCIVVFYIKLAVFLQICPLLVHCSLVMGFLPTPSVSLLVQRVYCDKTAEWIQMPFGVMSGVSWGMRVLDRYLSLKGKRQIWRWIWGVPFSTLTLLVGWHDGHLAWKNWVVRCWSDCLGQGVDLHMALLIPLPLTVSCFSKSRLVVPFWYQLTQVVPDKEPLNGCCCCYTDMRHNIVSYVWIVDELGLSICVHGCKSNIASLPTTLACEVMQSPPFICPSVCPSVCFHGIFWTDWPLTLIFCMCVGHYHGSQGIETEDHTSRSRCGWCDLDQGQFSSYCSCCKCEHDYI